jgi:hypothetical protein
MALGRLEMPCRFTATTLSQNLTSSWAGVVGPETPALLTSTCKPLKSRQQQTGSEVTSGAEHHQRGQSTRTGVSVFCWYSLLSATSRTKGDPAELAEELHQLKAILMPRRQCRSRAVGHRPRR